MNISFRRWVAVGMLAVSVSAQTQVDLRTQSKRVDFSAAASTKPAKTGTTLPATCSVGDVFFQTVPGANLYACVDVNTWTATGRRIPITAVADLPTSCVMGELNFVTDAAVAAGGWNLYTCGATDTWAQAGVQADGTGYIVVTCASPSSCLVGPNLSVLPTLTGPNAFLGSSDFSGASKTAIFRLASTAPATCDATAREAYFDTTTNVASVCSSTNIWTPVGGSGGSFLLYQNTNITAVTATGSTQTLDSFVIPAGKLRVGDILEIQATFARTGTAAPMTFGVSFGGAALQAIATPTTSTSAAYRPMLTVAGTASEVWGGEALVDGVAPIVIASTANATANVAAPITVSLTQSGTGPDTGAVASWFVKVTR